MLRAPSLPSPRDIHPRPTWIIIPLVLFLAVAGAAAVPLYPLLALPIVGLAGIAALSTLQSRVESIFLASLGVVLLGYLFQGKGFAYLGAPPLYVGELILLLGLVTLLIGRVRWEWSLLHLLVLAFMLLGLVRTVPFVGTEGINAIRDAALWYYGIFAVVISLMLTPRHLETTARIYARVLPVLVVWMVMMPVLFRFFVDALPHFPGSPLPIISIMKPGDRGVILAGCAAFMLCGLYARASGPRKMPPLVFWLCWFAAALLVAALNRGGLVAMTSALALLMLVQPSREWLKPVVIGGVVIAALLVVNPTIDVGKARPLSVTQLTANITSIFSDEESNTGSVQGTKEWRLNWWTDIYNDTVHGPSFWTGKGFGLNIADEYGYQTDEVAGTLRSPHNMHMTVLARMGVPGTVLWFVLQLTFAIQMILSLYRARSFKDGYAVQLHSWILAMWVAGLVNSTFDVYLEGPQGAIPFWCAFGAGLALLKFERQKREATAMQPYDAGRGTLYAHPARP